MSDDSSENSVDTTTTSNPDDALYKLKMIGSSLLGYPQTGAFNAPGPKGLL